MRFAVLLAVPATLLAPAAAQAAPTLMVTVAKPTVGYGAHHSIKGTLADGLTPLAAQPVVLEGRRYPYDGSYRVIAKATTDAKGDFTFKPKLDRDTVLRACLRLLAGARIRLPTKAAAGSTGPVCDRTSAPGTNLGALSADRPTRCAIPWLYAPE